MVFTSIRFDGLKPHLTLKMIGFSPVALLLLISSLVLFSYLNPIYLTYAQTTGPAQPAQPTQPADQGRPLSSYTSPVSPSTAGGLGPTGPGGNMTGPLGPGGNMTGPLGPGGNMTGPLGPGGNMPFGPANATNPAENAGLGNTGGGGGQQSGGGQQQGANPQTQPFANQTNQTVPGTNIGAPPEPVIFTKNLSNNSGTSTEQKIATSGNNVYSVWEDTGSGGNNDILFAKSTDNGATFGNVTNLSNNAGESINPKIAAFRNNVYVAWEDTGSGGNNDILFAKSTDNGATFGNVTTNLSNNTGESINPQMYASGNNVYVAWEDTTLKKSDILFKRSTNSGATFANVTTNLSNNTGESINPQMYASGNNVYVAWEGTNSSGNSDIMFARSPNNGATFATATTNLSNNAGESINPKIAAFRNNVYVAWEDYSLINAIANPISNGILFARSIDTGVTFGNTIRLSNNTGESINPQMYASGNNVYVAWEGTNSSGNSDIMFARSPNNGATFGNVIKVNAISVGQPLQGQPSDPQIYASGDNVYIAWTNRNVTTGNGVVVFAKSSNDGILFSDIRSISNPAGESALPQIATSMNNVYLIWSYDDTAKATDKTNSTLGSSDVIFLRGSNGNFPGSSLLAPGSSSGMPSTGGETGGGASPFGSPPGGAGAASMPSTGAGGAASMPSTGGETGGGASPFGSPPGGAGAASMPSTGGETGGGASPFGSPPGG